MTTPTPRPRGLAALSPERRREISSMGGKAQPASARSFSKDRDFASRAGAKGGAISRKNPVDAAE